MARPGAARTIGARRLRLPRQSFPTRCPLLALSGHFGRTSQCLLLGIKRTWRLRCEMSANDPKRTSSIPIGRCIRLASRVNIVSLLPFGCFQPGRFRCNSTNWALRPAPESMQPIFISGKRSPTPVVLAIHHHVGVCCLNGSFRHLAARRLPCPGNKYDDQFSEPQPQLRCDAAGSSLLGI